MEKTHQIFFEDYDIECHAEECLLLFVIELKKRIESKVLVKANISEHIYKQISRLKFKEIFYDQVNEIEGFNQYLLEVTIIKTRKSNFGKRNTYFQIIEIGKK